MRLQRLGTVLALFGGLAHASVAAVVSRPYGGAGNETQHYPEWTVRDLFREVDLEQHRVWVSFLLLERGAVTAESRCMLALAPPADADPRTWSWYHRQCHGGIGRGAFVSWGYAAAGDRAVMTVVSEARDRVAIFTFPHVNSGSYLGDAGPEPVFPILRK
ncbi:hypothetical protein GGS23DRAFT_595164 [Durotheca rogersii]|uniref:uncharacterized protein n=1 Tax=Durotheca rogersii TaxID=419775 RepID=UPI00221E804F|nr:uncharacterized protein GGS23DRAFT_595164 [Durotheca rogersii]KAI5865648.1 hypothetical protein GGS23DRAFT_595164 [Durotheca rogersii]